MPASIVYEDAATLAFMDIRPMIRGHTLVIPKVHAASLEELPKESSGPILETARKVATALRHSGLRCDGVNLWLADGTAAGQEVFHVHFHVLPRFRGDGFGIRVGVDSGRIAERADLDASGAKIRDAISRQ
ncbi:MAG: HIT family protein [Thermoplasmata archaeon]|nr:HIT family protein [Thermoplasmata archaeon]